MELNIYFIIKISMLFLKFGPASFAVACESLRRS